MSEYGNKLLEEAKTLQIEIDRIEIVSGITPDQYNYLRQIWRERARILIMKMELNKLIEQSNQGSEPARQGVGPADSDKNSQD